MGDEFQAKIDRFWDCVLHPLSGGVGKRFNGKGGYFYYFMAILTIVVFCFLGFNILNYTNTHVTDSGLGKKSLLTLESNDLTLISEKYNPKRHYAQVLISMENDDDPSLYKVETLVSELKSQQQLKSALVKVTDQYYVLKIFGVPKDYQQLIIDVGVANLEDNQQVSDVDLSNLLSSDNKSSDSEDDNFEQGTWKVSGVNMKKSRTLKPQSVEDYTILYAKLEQDHARKIIEKVDQVITRNEHTVSKLKGQITEQKRNERYQTKAEIDETEQNIDDLNTSVSNSQDEISDQKKLRSQLEEKIQKLELQRSDARKALLKRGEKIKNE